jgi:hypothetical protein
MPAPFQHIDEALEIGVGIGMRMVDRIADAGLRREMDNRRKPVFCQQSIHRFTISQIDLLESETRLTLQDVQARLFQSRIVIAVEIVQSDHRVAFGQQPARDMEADETRSTGDQYCLIRHRTPKTAPVRAGGSVSEASLPAALRVSQYPVSRLLPDWL